MSSVKNCNQTEQQKKHWFTITIKLLVHWMNDNLIRISNWNIIRKSEDFSDKMVLVKYTKYVYEQNKDSVSKSHLILAKKV